jgi:hypothetical protein
MVHVTNLSCFWLLETDTILVPENSLLKLDDVIRFSQWYNDAIGTMMLISGQTGQNLGIGI